MSARRLQPIAGMRLQKTPKSDGSLAPRVLLTGSAVAAGLLARKLARKSWEIVADEPPPLNPAAPSVGWRDAIAFTVGTAVFVGLARLVTRREVSRQMGRFA